MIFFHQRDQKKSDGYWSSKYFKVIQTSKFFFVRWVGIQKHDHSGPFVAILGQENHHRGHQCPLSLPSNDREELYHATLHKLCQSCLLKSKALVDFSRFDICRCCFHIFPHLSTSFRRCATADRALCSLSLSIRAACCTEDLPTQKCSSSGRRCKAKHPEAVSEQLFSPTFVCHIDTLLYVCIICIQLYTCIYIYI